MTEVVMDQNVERAAPPKPATPPPAPPKAAPAPGFSIENLASAIAKGVAAELKAQEPPAPEPVRPIDRRLSETHEGKMQYILLGVIGIGAVLSGALEYLGVDATPAYSLMAAGSAALLGNAWLGGKRQEAKATIAEVDSFSKK